MRKALTTMVLALAPGWAAADGPVLDGIGCPTEEVRIVVLGDSLADGLWGSLFRAFSACATVTVDRQTAVSDGLARTAPEDWLARASAGGAADLVVLQIGANDLTNIREGTTRYVHGTPEWDAAYAARAEALAEGLGAVADVVIWMGLPIVGQERFEPSYRAITALQAAAAEKAGARFVDTHEPTTFGEGQFVMSAEIDGTTRQIRVTDQVHFTELGYDLVAGLLRTEVERLFVQSSRDAALGAVALQ